MQYIEFIEKYFEYSAKGTKSIIQKHYRDWRLRFDQGESFKEAHVKLCASSKFVHKPNPYFTSISEQGRPVSADLNSKRQKDNWRF